MRILRRTFLTTMGAAAATAFSLPAILRAQTTTLANQRKHLSMDIKRNGSQPSGKGPDEYFTGTVRIDPLFEAPEPARARGASVTFEPGARTAWHTHPLGQVLIVTAGWGRGHGLGGAPEGNCPGGVGGFEPGGEE